MHEQLVDAVHLVGDVGEAARLRAVAVERDRLAAERLEDEVGDDSPVVRMHARAVGVEDAGDLDPDLVLAVVVEEQGLGAALALVVAGARAADADEAAIILRLRVHVRIAVDLAGGGLEDRDAEALGEPEHVDGPDHARLRGLHRVALIVDRGGGAGEIVDLVHLDIEREGHVVSHDLEARIAQVLGEIRPVARVEIIDREHVVSLRHQSIAQMAADKTGPTRHEDTLLHRSTSPIVGRSQLRRP